jgi:hypothetical protein
VIRLTMLVLAAAMLVASPAQATISERFDFSFEDSVQEDVCGIDARIDSTGSGSVMIRVGKNDLDQAFFGLNALKYSDTFTNVATGESFTIEGKGNFIDARAVHVEESIFEFTTVHAGWDRVVDADGKVVVRDSGLVRSTILFDTLGDSKPGGIVLTWTDDVRGPHPLFQMEEDEFCAMVHDLIG